ncbi:unnamed protein product [Paramecium sonneborni]|uniref:Uncharacterized protein n=1 Tax=Paramecium sonneborni TaxID=65129 RepID=A0A8S1RTG0_9CILI|nr:unnamed protein product [Paramecium sonneborni]
MFIKSITYIKQFIGQHQIIIRDEEQVSSNSPKRQPIQFQNQECLFFDSYAHQWLKKKYQIEFINNKQEIIYIFNGSTVRVKKFTFLEPDVFDNLEQINYLEWVGKYGKKHQKIAKWGINWNGQNLQKVGGYYSESGQKIGLWKELIKNYCSKVHVFEEGEYIDDKKIGRWKYIYQNKIIGLGSYDKDQKKIGRWVELWESFWDGALVTYNGEYNLKGIKIGKWEIHFDRWGDGKYKQIGFGQYDQQEIQQKVGRWVELWEGFWQDAQVTFNGEYNKVGIKIGRWDINFDKWGNGKNQQIGGGLYDQKGNKVGHWVELDLGFGYYKQITYNGEYNMKSLKEGRWNILACGKEIGGGSYDQKGIKIGKWADLDEEFDQSKQVIYNGVYNTKGKKEGRWDIHFCEKEEKYQQIGGGTYDLEGYKIGQWLELHEEFKRDKQVTCNGEYNMKGQKIGRWNILNSNQKNLFSGCVIYDESGNQIYKSENDSIIFVGQFKNRMKIDRWDILYKENQKEYIQIGGGSYNQMENKFGRWVEIDEEFNQSKQVIYNGVYNMKGIKEGRWDIHFSEQQGKYKLIGGGSYNKDGIKIGKWEELDRFFMKYYQIIYIGEYNLKGIKIGTWVEMNIKEDYKCGEKKYEE